MGRSENIRAYENAESLRNFSDRGQIVAYRKARLERYQPVVDFVLKRLGVILPASFLEIGSGSSALLYALASRNLLQHGLGIELSQSRHEFAQLWREDDGFHAVENVNQNFANVDLRPSRYDWCIVIDNTFTYLYPEDPQYPIELLRRARLALKAGGRVLLDFFNYARRETGIDYRQWIAFPESDPFSYGLYSNQIADGINCAESIFIKRDGTESRKREFSKVYSLADMDKLLAQCGFWVAEVFSGFDERPFVADSSERLVIVAAKSARNVR